MCEYCFGINGRHDPRCPMYAPPRPKCRCSVCGEGIYDGEEYIENYDGDCIHFECIQGLRWLVDWLGHDVKTMEDSDSDYF